MPGTLRQVDYHVLDARVGRQRMIEGCSVTEFSYFKVLSRRWILAAVLAVASVVTGAVMVAIADRNATVESSYFVSFAAPADATDSMRGNTFVRSRIKSYVLALSSSALLQTVVQQVPGAGDPQGLAKDIKVSSPSETDVINVAVTRPTVAEAEAAGKAITTQFPRLLAQIEGSGSTSPVKITVLKDSEVRAPEPNKTLLLSALLGLFLAAVVPFIPVPGRGREERQPLSQVG